MSQKELQRVAVIAACVKGDLACARAAELLDLTPRQIKHLKARYRQGSAAALAHAGRGRPSHRRLPDAVREQIVDLARSSYAGFNDHHLCEKLVEREGFSLSRETLRRLLRQQGLGPPRKRRAPAHRHRRVRSARLGELVQLDGSPHDWLEGRGPRLTALGMQDDATGKILAAQFFSSETAFGYLCLLRQLLRRHGLPLAFYGDRSGVFVRNDDHWTVEEQLAGKRQPTQFGRALKQLGITFIAARSPQAKGRVERLWGVLQDRLVSELRLAQADDIHAANAVLRKFTADYNRRFACQPREQQTAWRAVPESLERICCFVHERIVSNDNVVQWEGRRFQIPQQARRFSFAGAKVQIYQALNGRLSFYYGDTRLEHAAIPGG
ncbi:MAG TPA: ISNCY family transposase [Candidatus Acidoferrales bacterium]|nr:ISNCY family transposase [Candidatus Acidoferrales bacterium]